MTVAREAAGQPTGGQFAKTTKAGAAVSLAESPAPQWTGEDDTRLTELDAMDARATSAGFQLDPELRTELNDLRSKYLATRNSAAQGDSHTAPAYEYRG